MRDVCDKAPDTQWGSQRQSGARGRSDGTEPGAGLTLACLSPGRRRLRLMRLSVPASKQEDPPRGGGEGVRGKERSTRQNHEEPVPLAPGKATSRLPLSFIFLLRGQQATRAWETGKTPFRGHEALGSPKQACLVVRVTERARRESDQRLAV